MSYINVIAIQENYCITSYHIHVADIYVNKGTSAYIIKVTNYSILGVFKVVGSYRYKCALIYWKQFSFNNVLRFQVDVYFI